MMAAAEQGRVLGGAVEWYLVAQYMQLGRIYFLKLLFRESRKIADVYMAEQDEQDARRCREILPKVGANWLLVTYSHPCGRSRVHQSTK